MKRVLYLQYTNPAAYPPLEHSSRLLKRDGWQVLFLGIKAHATEALTFPKHEAIMVHYLPDCAPGWRQKLHYLKYVIWAIYWTLRWRPSWLYASDLLSCPVALLLNLCLGTKVIYHEHDTHSNVNLSIFMRVCAYGRGWLARRAKICVLPNQQRAELFAQEYPTAKTFCVWNCPTLDEVAPPRAEDEENFWLLYHGSIVPARLPLAILHALQLVPEGVKLRVIGYETIGHQGYVRELLEKAQQLGIERRIDFIGSVPTRSDLLARCRRSDVGLAFMPRGSNDINLRHMIGASNKAFDYLASRLALLVSDAADWKDLFVAPGYGLACDPESADEIAAAIRWLYEHREEKRQMASRGCERILTDWNYETQFEPILAFMNARVISEKVHVPSRRTKTTEQLGQ